MREFKTCVCLSGLFCGTHHGYLSQHHSGLQVPVTFGDVSVHFSWGEREMLAERRKENIGYLPVSQTCVVCLG
uniref:KRAB domain-containing protein n=1 Tax=Chelonoidis abingdonii TaxID=106734 RepID=A0A8C0IME7_CHEAB